MKLGTLDFGHVPVPGWLVPVILVGFVALVVVKVVVPSILSGDGAYGIIEGYVGRPGQGKTTLGVQHALWRAQQTNAILCSNIGITHRSIESRLVPVGHDGLDLGVVLEAAADAMEQKRGLVLFVDEAGICMPARFWQTFGLHLMWLLQQTRKLHCEIVYTSQSVNFVDAQLREVTAATHRVTAVPPATVARQIKGKRPWWINVATFDEAEVGREAFFLGKRRVRYRREFEQAFDTGQMVMPPLKLKGADELVRLLQRLVLAGAEPPVLVMSAAPAPPESA